MDNREQRIAELEKEVQELKKALAEAERLALIDPFTELFNRRGMKIEVARALAQAKRQGSPLAVLFIDVDKFKSINDTHGHDVGDIVLKKIAILLKETVRASDIVTRSGGDEFVIILPSSNLLVAQYLAHKIKERIADMDFTYNVRVGLSIGVASTSEGVRNFRKLKKLADERMYKEKASSQMH